jgi:hypothetical protein
MKAHPAGRKAARDLDFSLESESAPAAARLHVTAAKAEKELGVTFRRFPVTLADTVAWARTRLQEGS